jgi:hypothetical protein
MWPVYGLKKLKIGTDRILILLVRFLQRNVVRVWTEKIKIGTGKIFNFVGPVFVKINVASVWTKKLKIGTDRILILSVRFLQNKYGQNMNRKN